MRTYLKLYGPDLLKALPILEEISKNFSDISGSTSLREQTLSKKAKIKEGNVVLGKYDFSFDWHEEPTIDRVMNLIKSLDSNLSSTRIRYEVSTIEVGEEEEEYLLETGYSVSYLKLTGPGVYNALDQMAKIDIPQIDSHGLAMGHYDYYFAWNKSPSNEEIMLLIAEIDKLLLEITEFNVLYNLTTKDSSKEKKPRKLLDLKRLQVRQDRSGRFDKARFDLRRMT